MKIRNQIQRSKLRQIFDSAQPDSINLGLGEIQFKTPMHFREIAKQIIAEGKIYYTPNAGLPELRKKIAKHYHTDWQNVCVTTGAEEAIFAALFTYLEPGAEVLIANPSYLAYKNIIKMLDGKPKEFDLSEKNNFCLDRKSFINSITDKTQILILNNPSNPLGKSLNSSEIELIFSICEKHEILIIVDEVYLELFLTERESSLLSANTIVISSLSKSHSMSGWRIGWLVAQDNKLIDPMTSVHQYICTCAPYLSQELAIAAFSEKGKIEGESIRQKLINNHKFTIQFLKQYLPELIVLESSYAPYSFIKIEYDDQKFVQKALENKLILMPGSIFGSNGQNWIRLNYGVPQSLLINGLKIFQKTIKSLTD